MNTRILASTCALMTLMANACTGGNRPAQDADTHTIVVEPPHRTDVGSLDTTPDSTLEPKTVGHNQPPAADQNVTPRTPNSVIEAPKAAPAAVEKDPTVATETEVADNTKINTRDRRDALTPLNQGNSPAETKITADIRKGIIGDRTLSFNGKNVKVITVGSKVTLRGPVKSDREKTAIEAIAKHTAGVSEVDNQLEISN